MFDTAPPPKAADAGAPAWVMTFADLMSLLMCFFVLLLSFSEMDVAKYKQLAGSMKNAFGVQRKIKVKEPPKGVNVIAREFSPGRPDPTPLNVVRQMTTNDLSVNLDLGKQRRRPVSTPVSNKDPDRESSPRPGERAGKQADGLSDAQKKELEGAKKLAAARLDSKLAAAGAGPEGSLSMNEKSIEAKIRARADAERLRKLEQSAKLISTALGKEISNGSVDVETEGRKIIIRVREKASFGSGRAELKNSFRSLLTKVAQILRDSEGKIIVAGHTDNIPIYTERFRSNWELSSARAVSVAHEMMLASKIPSSRFLVQGFADTEPMVKNDTAANRSRNRRVEIVLLQGEDAEAPGRTIGADKPLPAKKMKALQPGPVTTGKTATVVPQRQPVRARSKSSATAAPARKTGSGGIRVGGTQGALTKPKPKSQPKSKPQPKPKPKPAVSSGIRVGGS